MNRLLSAAGTILVLTGIALLAYVGITYATAVPRHTARTVAVKLPTVKRVVVRAVSNQQMTVPKGQTSRAAGTTGPAIRMVIPKINVDARVAQTMPVDGSWDVVDWAVGHLATTPNPGDRGNGAYAAHDDIKGEIFKREDELKPGDSIFLYTQRALYQYVVTEQLVVDPTNVSVLAPTAAPTITLISCVPYWVDTERLVVHAVLKAHRAL